MQVVFLDESSLTEEQSRVHAFVTLIVADCLVVGHVGQVILETDLIAKQGEINDSLCLFNQLDSLSVLFRVKSV
jgi:hypothetical protein